MYLVNMSEDGIDYSERNGFLVGKSARMADWYHAKEAKAFKKLVERLRKRNARIAIGKKENARRQAIYMKRWRSKQKVKDREKAYKAAWEKTAHGRERKRLSHAKPASKAKAAVRNKAWKKANRDRLNARRRELAKARA